MTDTIKIVTIRARAFTCEGVRPNRCLVEADGTVRVWDDVAGWYTTCHILSEPAKRRARNLARQS